MRWDDDGAWCSVGDLGSCIESLQLQLRAAEAKAATLEKHASSHMKEIVADRTCQTQLAELKAELHSEQARASQLETLLNLATELPATGAEHEQMLQDRDAQLSTMRAQHAATLRRLEADLEEARADLSFELEVICLTALFHSACCSLCALVSCCLIQPERA